MVYRGLVLFLCVSLKEKTRTLLWKNDIHQGDRVREARREPAWLVHHQQQQQEPVQGHEGLQDGCGAWSAHAAAGRHGETRTGCLLAPRISSNRKIGRESVSINGLNAASDLKCACQTMMDMAPISMEPKLSLQMIFSCIPKASLLPPCLQG